MQPPSIEEFLTEEQHKALTNSISAIRVRVGKMPVSSIAILSACQEENLDYLSEIDPDGTLLIQKLTKINQNALYQEFNNIGEAIIILVSSNMQNYEANHSIAFLKDQISKEVNRACGSTNFNLRMQQSHGIAGNSLWDTLHDELIQIAMGISGFMHSHYDMQINQDRREQQVNRFLQAFRDRFEGKGKLSKIYLLNQKMEAEMIQLKNQSKQIDPAGDDEWAKVMDELESMQKKTQQQIMEEEVPLKPQLQIKKINDAKKQSQSPNFLQNLKLKSQNALKNVKALISKDSPFQQKDISQIQLQDSLQHYLQNLEHHLQIPQDKRPQIQSMATMSFTQITEALREEFDEREISIILYGINNPISKWNDRQQVIGEDSQRYQNHLCLLFGYSQQLQLALKQMQPGGRPTEYGQYLLAGLFFRALEKEYSTFAKRYLIKVLYIIENELDRKTKVYMRGALRIFEASTIRPTKLAALLSSLKPLRSNNFDQSHDSILYFQGKVFENSEKLQQEVNNCLFEIKKEEGIQENVPRINFSRLNRSAPSKTVTLVISGFLSEDSSADLEWMGLIRALEHTELYSATWQSSTIKELGMYGVSLAGELVLGRAAIARPLGIVGVAGAIATVFQFGKRIVNEYQGNPFAAARGRAAIVGIYLAELICRMFPDRFVNLVGFSLGTEVATHCLHRLSAKGKLQILNKVLMLGGAACQKSVNELLENSSPSLQLINLWSEHDYAIRYIYRLCRVGSVAVGSSNIVPISGHEVTNINCSKFVKSHMDFRCNLYGIGLLTGLIHD